jgi:3D-(3,5/4)-trihydroxycyclohexane-1,2-dione acylhydrolase (decyclizing)
VIEATDINDLKAALEQARKQTRTTVIVIETDPEKRVPGYGSWWDVPVAEVSQTPSVRTARKRYVKTKAKERYFL